MEKRIICQVNTKLGRASFALPLLAIFLLAGAARAQSTSFTYQGRLTDGGSPANGNYDLQFTLWDALSAGTQQPQASPATLTKTNIAVTGGVFSVLLDFGVSAFPGTDRFLEVGVRPGGSAVAFTLLAPRQQISSTPYAIRTLNATAADSLSSVCVGCVTDAQINSVAASKLTGTIPPSSLPAGGSFIQNTQNSTTQQANASFNISGSGTAAGTLSAGVQYNIGLNRVLSTPGTNNLFAGPGAGQANTSGGGNAFAGASAGRANTTGSNNSFFGFNAGMSNTGLAVTNAGNDNAFFGANAGRSITISNRNSFFGSSAGRDNRGTENSFFGYNAGLQSTTLANQNSFFGTSAGQNNTGSNNAFFGYTAGIVTTNSFNSFFGNGAGLTNTTGGFNTFVGANADFIGAGPNNTTGSNNTALGVLAKIGLGNGGSNLTNATAIGANAFVGQSNSLVLGSINGVNGATANTNVGIGTSNPAGSFQVAVNGRPTLSVLNTGHVSIGLTPELPCGGCSINALLQIKATGADQGVVAESSFIGVDAFGDKAGVEGFSNSGTGAFGSSTSGTGVDGRSTYGTGVYGESSGNSKYGIHGKSTAFGGTGVFGEGSGGVTGIGVAGVTGEGTLFGVLGITRSPGGSAIEGRSFDPAAYAGIFRGSVAIIGNLSVSGGTKNFKIDHPLDPANKYLYHASIESSEVLNIYSGNVTTDEKGDAVVMLPDWFEAINRDFRYQLTVIGTFAQAIVADEIHHNRFRIKTNTPNVKVSWQVTALRSDATMRKHPFVVEEDKPAIERGTYLDPEAFGQPAEKGVRSLRADPQPQKKEEQAKTQAPPRQ